MSELNGNAFDPIVGYERPDGEWNHQQFREGDNEANVEHALRWMHDNPVAATRLVLIYEGFVDLADGKRDAVIINARLATPPIRSFALAVMYTRKTYVDAFEYSDPVITESDPSITETDFEAVFRGYADGVDRFNNGRIALRKSFKDVFEPEDEDDHGDEIAINLE